MSSQREKNIQNLATLNASLSESINAFETFRNIYSINVPLNIGNVAGFQTVSWRQLRAPTSTAILCTEKLSRKYYVAILRKQPDYNQKNEGMTSSHTFKSVVVDASKGNSSIIALVMDTTQAKFATNHTIFSSNAKSTIAIGLQVTGNNVIKAGSVAITIQATMAAYRRRSVGKAAIQSSMHFQTSR